MCGITGYIGKQDAVPIVFEGLSNMNEVKARSRIIIGVSEERYSNFDYWIRVGDCGNLNPIDQVVLMRTLAYRLAALKGLDPRNLAKSVTVI